MKYLFFSEYRIWDPKRFLNFCAETKKSASIYLTLRQISFNGTFCGLVRSTNWAVWNVSGAMVLGAQRLLMLTLTSEIIQFISPEYVVRVTFTPLNQCVKLSKFSPVMRSLMHRIVSVVIILLSGHQRGKQTFCNIAPVISAPHASKPTIMAFTM